MTPSIELERLRSLFLALVGVYSPSGREEGVLSFLEEFLSGQGCPYGLQPVDEDRYNLLLGRPDAPLVFVGHVDTVEAWDLDAVGPVELADGWVGGLGTADMKGGCAAFVEAFLCLRAQGRARDLGVALVVGEEGEGDGARAFLREAKPGRVLVGEPTGLVLCPTHYGYLEVALSARGRRAHASTPERGQNAAETVLVALHALLQHRNAAEGGAVLNVRHFATRNPGFAVPECASAWVDLHLPPGFGLDDAIAGVRHTLDVPGAERLEVGFPTQHEGFQVAQGDALVEAWRALGRGGEDVFRSHSDANFFHEAGVPTLVLGPGRLEYAHSEEERVDFGEVAEAARLYLALAQKLVG